MLPTGLSPDALRAKASRHNGQLRPLITSHVSAIYFAADGTTILAALWCMWLVAGSGPWNDLMWLTALAGTVLFVFFGMRNGLYRSWRVEPLRQEVFWVVMCWGIAMAVLTLLAVMLGYELNWRDQPVVLAWYGLGGLALAAQRVCVRYSFRALRAAGRNYRQVAILGATEQAVRLRAKIANSSWMGLRLHGVYDDRASTPGRVAVMDVAGNTNALLRAARAGDVDVVYIALPLHAVEPIRRKILALMDTTASVYLVPDFFVFGLLDSRVSHVDDIPVFTVAESPFDGLEGWTKRAEDLILGGLIMLLILVPMLAIAVGIKLTSKGPVFFRQNRYGLDGRAIAVWKFRSMRVTEDGSTTFKQATRHDSRITPFGAFLRRTSLDELPQFINVLGGSMSIVGPRPHPIALNESFRSLIPGYMLRHKVKPGITGWAQVNGWRGETDTLEKMEKRIEYDLDYLRCWSLWFDLKIIALTVVRGFTGSNAY